MIYNIFKEYGFYGKKNYVFRFCYFNGKYMYE